MKIIIQDYSLMRYETCGDYVQENGEWVFYIARLSKRPYEACVALHEIVECYLCYWLGIKEPDIMAFDIEHEKNRPEGDESEPGNDKNAPYYYQHQIATFIEYIFSKLLFVNWKKYEQDINSL